MKFEVLILGSSSATPMYGRHPSSQLINHNEQFYLIDCGEGTQMQLTRFGIKANRIKHIFISHLHGDHYLGLMGLLSSMHLVGRREDLHLYGPPALWEILDLQFRHSQTVLRYALHFHPTQDNEAIVIYDGPQLAVRTFPIDHRIPCTGFRFVEKQRLPSINKDKVSALGIPPAHLSRIKRGQDYVDNAGKIHPWQDLTLPAPPPRSYAYCSDTVYSGRYVDEITGVDTLYHEATFLHEMLDRATETFHTTALQAGQIAARAGVQQLLIGHYSARYKDLNPLLEESRTVFSNTKLALEGSWYPISSEKAR